jgi:hypothetical protein
MITMKPILAAWIFQNGVLRYVKAELYCATRGNKAVMMWKVKPKPLAIAVMAECANEREASKQRQKVNSALRGKNPYVLPFRYQNGVFLDDRESVGRSGLKGVMDART